MTNEVRILSPFDYDGFYRRDEDYDQKHYRDIYYIVKRGLQSAELNDHRYYDYRNFTAMFQGLFADGDILKNGGYAYLNGEITFGSYRLISNGYPVDVPEQIITISIEGTHWVGINVESYIVDAETDPGLNDPAPPPAENTGLEGAVRLRMIGSWKRETDPRPAGSTFYPIYCFVNGVVYNADVIDPQQSKIEETISRYDEAANGPYVSKGTRVTYERKRLVVPADFNPPEAGDPYTVYVFSLETGTFNIHGRQYSFSSERTFEVPDMTDYILRENEPITFKDGQKMEVRVTLESQPLDTPVNVTNITKTVAAGHAIVTVADITKFINNMTVLIEGASGAGMINANGYHTIDTVTAGTFPTGTFRMPGVDTSAAVAAQTTGAKASPPKNQLLNYIKIGNSNYEYTSAATTTNQTILDNLAALINADVSANSLYTATVSPASPNSKELIITSVGNVPFALPIVSAYLKTNLVSGAITEYYPLDYGDVKQVVEILGTKNSPNYPENVTRQPGLIDTFASSAPLKDIVEVKYLTTVYSTPGDYIEFGNGLQWQTSPVHSLPVQGAVYQVKYTIADTQNYPSDILNPARNAVKLINYANNTDVFVTYEYWLKRRDTVMLGPEGIIYMLQGISKYENPTPVSITHETDLGVATLLISRSDMNRIPEVKFIFPPAYTMREIQEMQQKLTELQVNLSRSALLDNIARQDPTNNKTNMFVDGLLDSDLMDLGAYSVYAPGERVVAISHSAIHLPVTPYYAYTDADKIGNHMLPFTDVVYREQLKTTKARRVVEYIFPEAPKTILADISPTNHRYIAKYAQLTPIDSIQTVQHGSTAYTTSSPSSAPVVTTTDIAPAQWDSTVLNAPTPAVAIQISAKNFLPGTTVNIYFNGVYEKSVKLDSQSGEMIKYPFVLRAHTGRPGINALILEEAELIPPATAYRRASAQFQFIPQQRLTITPVAVVVHIPNPPPPVHVTVVNNVSTTVVHNNVVNNPQNQGGQGGGGDSDRGGHPDHDPIGETFFPTEDMYFTKYEVVFDALGGTPLTMSYAPTIAGVPDNGRVKNAVSLLPAAITKGAWTAFRPKSPTFTEGGQEHCPYIACGDPVSTIQVAQLNYLDRVTGARVMINPFIEGVMVSSSNSSTWTPIQDEDIRFRLFRAKFTTNTFITKDLGTLDLARLPREPVEVLSLSKGNPAQITVKGAEITDFKNGQRVYVYGGEGTGFKNANGESFIANVTGPFVHGGATGIPAGTSVGTFTLTGINTNAGQVPAAQVDRVDVQPESVVSNVTDLMLMVGVISNTNTKIEFKLKLMGRDVSTGGTFVPETHTVLPYQSIMIAPYSGPIKVEAILWSGDDHVSPEVDEDVQVMCGKVAPKASYISREFDVSGDMMKCFIEVYQPSATQVNIMFLKGSTWTTITRDPDYSIPKDNGFVEYSYTAAIAPGAVPVLSLVHGSPPTCTIASADVASFKNGSKVTIAGATVEVVVTNLTSANPAVCTVATGDIGKFVNGMVVQITGASGTGVVAANGFWTISAVTATTFTLTGCNTSGGAAQTNGLVKAWPAVSNVNGIWTIKNVNSTTNSFQLEGCVSTGATQNSGVTAQIQGLLVEGVNKTRLRVQLVGHAEDAQGVWTSGNPYKRPMARAFRVYVTDTTTNQ